MLATVVAAILFAAGCSGSDPASTTSGDEAGGGVTTTGPVPAAAPSTSETYTGTTNWLCHPDRAGDPCDTDLTATVVAPDGNRTIEVASPAAEPAADCFYVYPTVSSDPTTSSDLVPGPDEERAAVNQAARFSEVCRVFAPVHRQVTVAGLLGGGDRAQALETAYADVLDAWEHYLADGNDGRPVVLIGHSQGAGHLKRLLREEIDPDPAERARLVSALLLGHAVAVPDGADVGGDFEEIPLCRADDQTGCVVTYATFRDGSPPPANSYFGRVREGDGIAGCTNPAALAGGDATLHPYFRTDDVGTAATGVTTPYVTFADAVTARCVERDGFSYLEVAVDPSATVRDERSVSGSGLGPEWGLHLVDANIAMGDLVGVVRDQIEAFAG